MTVILNKSNALSARAMWTMCSDLLVVTGLWAAAPMCWAGRNAVWPDVHEIFLLTGELSSQWTTDVTLNINVNEEPVYNDLSQNGTQIHFCIFLKNGGIINIP